MCIMYVIYSMTTRIDIIIYNIIHNGIHRYVARELYNLVINRA